MSYAAWRRRSRSSLVLFVVVALLATLIPRERVVWSSIAAAAGIRAEAIRVYGNSVVDAKSICDRDPTTIAGMLQEAAGRPVVDLSQGGQYLDFALGNAALATGLGRGREAVVYVSLFHLMAGHTTPLATALLFQGVSAGSLARRFADGVGFTGAIPEAQLPFEYRGVDYPGYATLGAVWYGREKSALVCPSKLGVDRTFIEANYWKAYLRPALAEAYFDDLARVQKRARDRGNRVTYVLLPIDFEDVAGLDAQLAEKIRTRLSEVRRRLAAANVDWLDLAEALPAAAFADRFCACGHLAEDGRRLVAARTRDALLGR